MPGSDRGRRGYLKRRSGDALYLLALLARRLGRTLPRKTGLALFGAAGAVVYRLARRDRTLTLRHLGMIYGDAWSGARIEATARAVFRNLGMNLFDAIHLATLDNSAFDRIVTGFDPSEVKKATDAGRGAVVITGHIGCFETQLPMYPRRGIPAFAIGQQLFDPRLDAMVSGMRSGPSMEYVKRTDNPRMVVRKLAEGKAMGVLIDQDTDVEGVFVHFLGRLAYTPSGVVKLAMRMEIPVFVMTTARQKDNTHRAFLDGPIALAVGGDRTADLLGNMEMINAKLCATIERYPEQWVWMHRRWRRKPQGQGMGRVPNIEN